MCELCRFAHIFYKNNKQTAGHELRARNIMVTFLAIFDK